MREPVVLLWSGGKDSTLALQALRQDERYEPSSLLTTVTEGFERVSMHGVRTSLIEAQAASLNLSLLTHRIPEACSNNDYEATLLEELGRVRDRGITVVVAGDIFLEDVRRYREDLFARAGMKGYFPLWGRDTRELAESFIDLGFEAKTSCVDTQALPASFAGRPFDREFLADLPEAVDPSGEYGEFHTFVYDGPLFDRPVPNLPGGIVVRDSRFCFCDLLPPSVA